MEAALGSSTLDSERKQKCEILQERATKVYEVANAPRFRESWDVYPFNSGYFMCVQVRGVDAEAVRIRLLAQEGIGVIATGGQDVRVAFSCLEVEDVQPLFEALHAVVSDLQ